MHKILISSLIVFGFLSCSSDDSVSNNSNTEDNNTSTETETNIDTNDDGELNILILGSSTTIYNTSTTEAFNTEEVANELTNIFENLEDNSLSINVTSEDIYQSKLVNIGLGSANNRYYYNCYSHSLMQYYYWPENQETRINSLNNTGDTDWDYIIIGADPYMVANLPEYYAVGVNKVLETIAAGDATAMLLSVWQKDESDINKSTYFTQQVAQNSPYDVSVVKAAEIWSGLDSSLKDTSTSHPSPNGSYVAAAAIYSKLTSNNATASNYVYNDALANAAYAESTTDSNYTTVSYDSPFSSCDIDDLILSYNHTGSSSENGILTALNWAINQINDLSLVNGEDPITDFNFGRANTNFEANKRYNVDSASFKFSFGFPMQDYGSDGSETMLYGIDNRHIYLTNKWSDNGTDVMAAIHMINEGELPYGRAIPIRTLYAQIEEFFPGTSAYRDLWHMSRDIDKAAAGYMITLLTGEYQSIPEPTDTSSDEWKDWKCYYIGCNTAYQMIHLGAMIE